MKNVNSAGRKTNKTSHPFQKSKYKPRLTSSFIANYCHWVTDTLHCLRSRVTLLLRADLFPSVLPPGGQGCAASRMFILFTGHKYQGTRSVRVRLPVICISKHAHWYKLMYSMTIPLFSPIYLGWVFSLILKNCVFFFKLEKTLKII